MRDLKSCDRRLYMKKNIDWSLDIMIHSRFEKKKDYVVFKVTNQFKWNWILNKLKSMDSQHINILKNIEKKNLEIRNRKSDDRQHRDMADFIRNWEQIII